MNFLDVWKRHDFADVSRSILAKTPADVRRALGRPRGSVSLDDLAALLFKTSANDAAGADYPSAILRLDEIARLAPATPGRPSRAK